jgi:hypothetical protein
MASAKTRRGRRSAGSTNASRTPGPALRRLSGEHAWQEWQGSAFARVRSRSPAAREPLETGGLSERARTGANGREHLPCRRSRVRVPSSASRSSWKSADSVVRPVNDRGPWQGSSSLLRAPTVPESPRLASRSRWKPRHESPANRATSPRPVQDGVDARSQFASISSGGLASVYRRSCLQKVMSVRQSRRVEHSASRSDPVPGQFGAERIDVGCYLMCAFR